MNDKKYIALVDDHTMFRKGMAMLINLFPDYKVLFEANNGKDFIKQLQPLQLPDIVLLDITMPEMNGYETAKWIKANYPQINILALSTMDAETSIIQMIKNGANGYILKDAEPAELKLAFKEVIEKGFFYNEMVSQKILKSINLLTNANSSVNTLADINEIELEFLRLCCTEKSYKEIATAMHKSSKTIDNYRENLFEKLNVHSRVGLVLYAIRSGLVIV